MVIRKAKNDELDRCIEIVRNLSDWFNDTDMIGIEKSIRSLPVYVYDDNDTNCGKVRYYNDSQLEYSISGT